MVRRGPNRQSLNSSVVSQNNSILDETKQVQCDYSDFVKQFPTSEFRHANKLDLILNRKAYDTIKEKIEDLLYSNRGPQALVTGPPGSGKTTIIRKLAEDYSKFGEQKLTFFYLRSSWTLDKRFGHAESRIRSLFEEAINKAPSLILIDKLDLISSDKRSQTDSKERILNALEEELDNIDSLSANVLVLAATSRPEFLDARMREPSRFVDKIEFTLPTKQERVEILNYLTDNLKSDLNPSQIEELADTSHHYSYRNLSEVCNKAIRRCKIHNEGMLNLAALKWALTQVKPAFVQSITTPCQRTMWTDIGGMDDVKAELIESVIWPLEHRQEFLKLRIRPNKGALLYGPPGCSKTMLARALATESGYNFISIKGPELISKYVGDSEAAVRKLYRNAREIAPCIIFFDEIDSLAGKRSDEQNSSVGYRAVSQLLTELDGVEPLEDVFTLAATNCPDRVDRALLRPGRLNPAIYIPLPSKQDRVAIFAVHMRDLPLKFAEPLDTVIDQLASLTSGYSGSEIADICRVAGRLAIRETLHAECYEWRHFNSALEIVKPETTEEDLKAHIKFLQKSRRQSLQEEQEPLRITKTSRFLRMLSLRRRA